MRKRISYAFTVVTLLTYTHLLSGEYINKSYDQDKIIEKNGDYTFISGPSYMTLHSDHRFTFSPMGVSGRTIDGWWKSNGKAYVIVGN